MKKRLAREIGTQSQTRKVGYRTALVIQCRRSLGPYRLAMLEKISRLPQYVHDQTGAIINMYENP